MQAILWKSRQWIGGAGSQRVSAKAKSARLNDHWASSRMVSTIFVRNPTAIRYIGMKIIDENESVEKAHAILKVWGDALQTITSPKPSPPPTLKSWWFYRWNRFRQRTDKWGLLQWYLVILGIIACVLFSSLYQNRVMDLDRTNRIFYKKVIMDEKRKRNYQELDSLIHSDSFFKTYWGLNN